MCVEANSYIASALYSFDTILFFFGGGGKEILGWMGHDMDIIVIRLKKLINTWRRETTAAVVYTAEQKANFNLSPWIIALNDEYNNNNNGSHQQRRYNWIPERPRKAQYSSYWWQPRESIPLSTVVCSDPALQRSHFGNFARTTNEDEFQQFPVISV